MNGAQSLIRTLVDAGVRTCFTNPGTSEMHFVAALDTVAEMRSVLGLFEGVVTGAADGYARMAGVPAATLLHLGPGLANGMANLHNARRARSPIVNIVGDHATYHQALDAPLASDIVGVANNVSRWVRESKGVLSFAYKFQHLAENAIVFQIDVVIVNDFACHHFTFKYELIARLTTSANETFSRLAAAFSAFICFRSIKAISLVSFTHSP